VTAQGAADAGEQQLAPAQPRQLRKKTSEVALAPAIAADRDELEETLGPIASRAIVGRQTLLSDDGGGHRLGAAEHPAIHPLRCRRQLPDQLLLHEDQLQVWRRLEAGRAGELFRVEEVHLLASELEPEGVAGGRVPLGRALVEKREPDCRVDLPAVAMVDRIRDATRVVIG
jgi:hypothetical protein